MNSIREEIKIVVDDRLFHIDKINWINKELEIDVTDKIYGVIIENTRRQIQYKIKIGMGMKWYQ